MMVFGAWTNLADQDQAQEATNAYRAMERFFNQRGMRTIPIAAAAQHLSLGIAISSSCQPPQPERLCSLNHHSSLFIIGQLFGQDRRPCSPVGTEPSTLKALHARLNEGRLEDIYRENGEFSGLYVRPEHKCLVLFADHFGTHPIYYHHQAAGVLLFATTPAALLSTGMVSQELNVRALAAQLAIVLPPAGETVFKAIKAVPPASTVQCYHNRNHQVTRRWTPVADQKWGGANRDRISEAFRDELVRAVLHRLPQSSTPALSLSAGLDSGVIACIVASEIPETRILSYTDALPEGYLGRATDERPQVNKLAAAIPNLRPRFIDGADTDPLNFGEFTFDRWAMPASHVQGAFFLEAATQASQAGASIFIGGLGGDQCVSSDAEGFIPELLINGNPIQAFRALRALCKRRRMPLGTALSNQVLAPLAPKWLHSVRAQLQGHHWLNSTVIRPEFASRTELSGYLENSSWRDPERRPRSLNEAARINLETLLGRGGLGSGPLVFPWLHVDVRYPLLDWQLIERYLAAPSHEKVSGEQERLLFRNAARALAPEFIVDRPDKSPGSPHMADYLRQQAGRLREAFSCYKKIGLWDEMVDDEKVLAELGMLVSSDEWALTWSALMKVIQPYYIGDFLCRMQTAGWL